jgi:glucose/arabinose dehydrogenase
MSPSRRLPGAFCALVAVSLVACSPTESAKAAAKTGGEASAVAAACAPGNDGLTLPEGFCAVVVVDSLPGARHLEVAANGDVFVSVRNISQGRGQPRLTGGVAVLRDTTGDGRADEIEQWGVNGGNDVVLADGYVYSAPDDAVLRYPIQAGAMTPSGPPDTVVSGLPAVDNHTAKSIALGPDGSLYVNIGSPSNACQQQTRTAGSPGQDPCPQREVRAGIWRFDANTLHQTEADGTRFAAGMRNTVALRMDPLTHVLYGVVHGRDSLHDLWPDLFTVDQSTEKPAEEFVRVERGDDYGWPYCYYDPETHQKVLAPEYGGNGHEVGRCAGMKLPLVGFPAHWAPDDLEFYTGSSYPSSYAGGAFIAFHGSWNRAPNPQDGYRVVFLPRKGDGFASQWQVFADGFRNESGLRHAGRPVGLSVGPDGSLYVSEDVHGRIWRIVYGGM